MSAVLNSRDFFVKIQLELVRVVRETSRHRTGTDGTPAGGFWFRLNVCALAIGTTRGRTGRGYGIFVVVRKGLPTCQKHFCFVLLVLIVMHQTLSRPTINRRVGMTNVTDVRRQWSSSVLHEAVLAVVVLPWMCCCRSQPRRIQ